MKFKVVIREILDDVAPTHRATTQERYYIYLGDMLADIGNRDLDSFTSKDFNNWIRKLRARKPKRNTFDDYTKFINIVYNYAYQNRYTPHRMKFKKVDVKKNKTGTILTKEELAAIVAVIPTLYRDQKKTMLKFLMAYEMFMRKRETLYLELARIDLERKVIILNEEDVKTGSKTRRGRDIPINSNVFGLLEEVIAELLKSDPSAIYLFPSPVNRKKPCDDLKTAWKEIKKRAKIKRRIRWHDIRHTALSHAVLDLKLPLAHISRVSGVSIRVLMSTYVHHDIEQLRFITESMKAAKIA